MDDLMLRRRMMANQEEPRPYPYSIRAWKFEHDPATAHDHGMTIELSNWNHFRMEVTETNTDAGTVIDFFTGAFANGAETGGTAAVLTLPAYLSFSSGDQVELRYKNIVNPNAMPYLGRVYTAETGAQITALQFSRVTDATDKTLTTTISADTAVGSIGLYFVRTGFVAGDVFECDIELYVNGQRWI